MDGGISKAIGGGATVSLCGRLHMLEPFTIADLATLENHIASQRHAARLRTLQGMQHIIPPAAYREQWQRALYDDDNAEPIDVREYVQTVNGVSLALWLCLKTSIAYEAIRASVLAADDVEFAALRHAVGMVTTFTRRLDDIPPDEPSPNDRIFKPIFQPKKTPWADLAWVMVAPPEAGGHGMQPSELRRLTLYELLNYCRGKPRGGGRKLSHHEALEKARKTDPAKLAAAKEEIRRRRLYYTGKETLD